MTYISFVTLFLCCLCAATRSPSDPDGNGARLI